MFQAVCTSRFWGSGSYCGSVQQTRRRRELMLVRALPPPARFDREMHLRIHQAIDTHLSHDPRVQDYSCQGAGGDLFFAIRLYKSQLAGFPRYPQSVQWV